MTEKQQHLKNTLKKVLPSNVAFPLLVDALAAFFGVRLEFIERTKWALLHTNPKYLELQTKLMAERIAITTKKQKCLGHKRETAKAIKLQEQMNQIEASLKVQAQTEVDQVIDNVLLNLECTRSMDRVVPVGENALSLLDHLSSYKV